MGAAQGAAGGEAKPHSPPWTLPYAPAHLFLLHCSAEPIPSVPAGPLGAQDGTGGSGVWLWGFAPLAAHSCAPWAAASAASAV